jgi:XTP/dITP diphosphohydrolase
LTEDRRWILASHNRGKGAEFARLLQPYDIRIDLALTGAEEVVAETGDTYRANAALKAHAVARRFGRPALGDDSGLEVDVLDGRPGLHSAHYRSADAAENVRAVLLETLAVPWSARTCRMRAVVVLAWPDGREEWAEGVVEGHLGTVPRGIHGFGYDPIFVLPDGRTMAELSPAEKDGVSHRGRALRALMEKLGIRSRDPAPPGISS